MFGPALLCLWEPWKAERELTSRFSAATPAGFDSSCSIIPKMPWLPGSSIWIQRAIALATFGTFG